ncbi:3-isopropylmalate/(R)-2-methylmalate dehydratase small subunit [Methanolinea mesophila]|uniref:3-isopropylmalate dehydratase small subunit n=1 Tax=Methanolinea mesophila TaxID=547055 RepID=UPI001AE9DF6D|nr:3-isopropylmalate dehydratase small subunit [Methanolinea mesophila]MBP1927654.1 3-isopropylmalate/(R)-2-methylmalate dehydratase small subunit [Methanolinea mesophila]
MRAWKFGDNIDTDAIIPGRFLTIYDPKELASHAFEGIRHEFAKSVRPGDVIVAGRNFGCGSSREHAPHALSGAGVRFVIARTFARIFYRNAINVGLLPLVCEDADRIRDGAEISVDIEKGFVESEGARYRIEPVPDFLQQIVNAGGLVDYAKDLTEVETCTGSRR